MSEKRLKKGVAKKVEREGSAVVVLGPVGKNGLHLEKRVALHCVRVPEQWATEAFDFLRRRLAGQEIEFDDYALEEGTAADVFVSGKAVSVELVARGLARPFKGPKPSKLYDQLIEATRAAEEGGLGLHGAKAKPSAQAATRSAEEAVDSTLQCWVEELNFDLSFKVAAAGINGVFDTAFLGVAVPVISKEHANAFRNWASRHALQRDFEARLVTAPGGQLRLVATRPGDPDSVVGRLLALGWARLESDAAAKLDSLEFLALRALQEQAMNERLRLWKTYQGKLPRERAAVDARWAGEFEARVVEVNSGDAVTLQKTGEEARVRVFLSHVRAPALEARGEEPRPWAWEAKEHLRRALIGKKVKARVDAVRRVEKEGREPLEVLQATLYLEDGRSVGEELLEKGLAAFHPPRGDDPVSAVVKELAVAAAKAEKARRGLHGKPAPRRDLWDLSLPQNRRKAKELGLEAYAGREAQDGVVEFVFSASRFKLRFEKENCLLIFSLNGVRALEANPNQPGWERWAAAALEFARSRLTQREVRFEVEALDRQGIAHGILTLGGKDCAGELLSRGLAYVVAGPRGSRRAEEYRELEAAARSRGAGFWAEGVRPQQEEEELDGPIELLCRCSHFESPERFYLRRFEAGDALDARIAAAGPFPPAVEPLKPGTLLLGPFEGGLFRCRLLRREQESFVVQFIDYGNTARLGLGELRQLPAAFSEPPLAFAAGLDLVIFPPPGSGFEAQTTELASEFLESERLHVIVNRRGGGVSFCVVGRVSGLAQSLNVRLLRAGLVGLNSAASEDAMLGEAEREGAEANPELAAIITNSELNW